MTSTITTLRRGCDLALNPDSAKAHVGLASTLVGKGKLDEAHTHYEQALRMEPNNAEYHSGYAYLLEQLGQDDQAAAECEAAVRLAPNAQSERPDISFLAKAGDPAFLNLLRFVLD